MTDYLGPAVTVQLTDCHTLLNGLLFFLFRKNNVKETCENLRCYMEYGNKLPNTLTIIPVPLSLKLQVSRAKVNMPLLHKYGIMFASR
jgi:hypothetical protein